MPSYYVTCNYNTSFSQVILVEAATPEEACAIAVSRGNRGSSPPNEMLVWQTSIGWLQDYDYGDLNVPIQYADAAERVRALEEILRQVIAANIGEQLPMPLVRQAHEVLGVELPAILNPDAHT